MQTCTTMWSVELQALVHTPLYASNHPGNPSKWSANLGKAAYINRQPPNPTTVHPRTTRNAMEPLGAHDLDRPISPKKHRADMLQGTAEPTYRERPRKKAVRQRVHKCQCCACDWTEDITLDSVTRSCGDPICTFCKDQLRSRDEPLEEEIPQASDDKSSHENTGGSDSHKAQVGHKNADDSLAAQKESSEENAPLEGADESSRRDADRSSHIAKVLDNMRLGVEYW
jgi:hypothetical protein